MSSNKGVTVDTAAAANAATATGPTQDSAVSQGDTSPVFTSPFKDRRESDEWDAAKVPPSRFQKRKGSIYSTPSSRDGHVDSNYAAAFHEKHAEKGYGKK